MRFFGIMRAKGVWSMKTHNINLSDEHYKEAQEALKKNQQAIDKKGDTILELEDGTRVLLIFRMNTYLFQSLDSLL